MDIFAIVESLEHVCARYRVSAFKSSLAAEGFQLKLTPWPSSIFGRLRLIQKLRGKTVILQRKLIAPGLVWLLRQSVQHLIFDFDDAVFLRDSYSPRGLDDPGRMRRFRAICKASDAVVAGNQFLARQAALAAPATRVLSIPTCVETNLYPFPKIKTDRAGLELVWIGSSSTLNSLERIQSLLDAIGEAYPQVYLKVICDRFPKFQKLRTINCPWSGKDEIFQISSADAGICHMPDDQWSEGKCGLKLLQYMAAGIPTIANPVGVHKEIILPGSTGFLASSRDEWLGAVRLLLEKPNLAAEIGHNARNRVLQQYSVEANAPEWVQLLKDVTTYKCKAG